jgi:hypothetical protein
MQPRTQARTRKNATKLVDECIAHKCGVFKPSSGKTVLDRSI